MHKKIKSIIVIAVCILFIIFGLYHQYVGIKNGNTVLELADIITFK